MWTDFIIGLGNLFLWTFKFLPYVGDIMSVVLFLTLIVLLAAWTIKLIGFGDEKDKEYVPKKKFPFL